MESKRKEAEDYTLIWPYNIFKEVLGHPSEDIITDDQMAGLEYALAQLSQREKESILLYFKEGLKYREIGSQYLNVTTERVRQIIVYSLRKLRNPAFKNVIENGYTEQRLRDKEHELTEKLAFLEKQENLLSALEQNLDNRKEKLGYKPGLVLTDKLDTPIEAIMNIIHLSISHALRNRAWK